jgi:SAM-dependent methyltransferase
MGDIYEQLWSAQEYLRQYYTTDYVADDERANFEVMIAWLQQSQRVYQRCLDFGCGCTLHHVMPLVPYVEEIHLADYLPENLVEIQKWLDDRPDAHNWDVYLREVLALENDQSSQADDLSSRKQELRNKITTLKLGNVLREHPLSDTSTYDLVTSFYCVEAVTSSKEEWRLLMSNLCRLVAPGGSLFLSVMRNCQFYKVMENRFPVAPVDKADLIDVLLENKFEPSQTEVQVVQIQEWADQGFDGICIVKAQKLLD